LPSLPVFTVHFNLVHFGEDMTECLANTQCRQYCC